MLTSRLKMAISWMVFVVVSLAGIASATETGCLTDTLSKSIICYAQDASSVLTGNIMCKCTHLVVPYANTEVQEDDTPTIKLDEGTEKVLRDVDGKMSRILSLALSATHELSSSYAISIVKELAKLVEDRLIDGVEIDWQKPNLADAELTKKDRSKLVTFVKEMKAVFAEITIGFNQTKTNRPEILLRLPVVPEQLVKAFDLKALSRSVDLFIVSTHNITESIDRNATYHHSRLMGLSDIANTDSILDLISSLGVPSERLVAAVPTFAIQFQLASMNQNTPGSPTIQGPNFISNKHVCSMLSNGEWTIERDDDLTGTYAYNTESSWIAFEDTLSSLIKAKYFMIRDIAGVAIMTIDLDDPENFCNLSEDGYPITSVYGEIFQSTPKSKREIADSLISDLSTSPSELSPIYSDRVKASPYRIVRIVERSGETAIYRQATETNLRCSRQGYYRHPEDCSRFYRCVKFDQYVDDFTVFMYDCPEGLVFDEKWEVCTWPSQAAPCGGSSEIQPVPTQKFVCPGEGYFADPENCRWFFACRDYSKDGSFTQYEFRCPFGLVFDAEKLLCNWPWLVPNCGGKGGYKVDYATTTVRPVPIGSPGYLSGKLVTGEGLYKDPRPSHYSEGVYGCVDCSSGVVEVKDGPVPAAKVVSGGKPVVVVTGTTSGGKIVYPSAEPYVHQEGAHGSSYSKVEGYAHQEGSQGYGEPYVHREGPQGTQGTSGSYGPSGPNGPYGQQGPQGPSGSYGPNGPYVPQGPQGPPGSYNGQYSHGSYESEQVHLKQQAYPTTTTQAPTYTSPAYKAPITSYPSYKSPEVTSPNLGYKKSDQSYSTSDYKTTQAPGTTYKASEAVYPTQAYKTSEPGYKPTDSYKSSEPSYKLSEPSYTTPAYKTSETSYSAPAYKASEPSYSSSSYKAPEPTYKSPSYKTPEPSYPSSSYKASEPSYKISEPSYPAPAYKDAESSYSAPAYKAPEPSYSAPAYTYSAPAYKAPEPTYPASAYRTSEPSYPAPAYKAIEPSYLAPAYKASEPSYPASTYKSSSSSYSAPAYKAPETSHPAPAYKAPEPSYSTSTYKPAEASHSTTSNKASDLHKSEKTSYKHSEHDSSATYDHKKSPYETSSYSSPAAKPYAHSESSTQHSGSYQFSSTKQYAQQEGGYRNAYPTAEPYVHQGDQGSYGGQGSSSGSYSTAYPAAEPYKHQDGSYGPQGPVAGSYSFNSPAAEPYKHQEGPYGPNGPNGPYGPNEYQSPAAEPYKQQEGSAYKVHSSSYVNKQEKVQPTYIKSSDNYHGATTTAYDSVKKVEKEEKVALYYQTGSPALVKTGGSYKTAVTSSGSSSATQSTYSSQQGTHSSGSTQSYSAGAKTSSTYSTGSTYSSAVGVSTASRSSHSDQSNEDVALNYKKQFTGRGHQDYAHKEAYGREGGVGGIGDVGGTGGIGGVGYNGPKGLGATGYKGPDYDPSWDGPNPSYKNSYGQGSASGNGKVGSVGGVGGTGGIGGVGYDGPRGLGATGYKGPDYDPSWDGPSSTYKGSHSQVDASGKDKGGKVGGVGGVGGTGGIGGVGYDGPKGLGATGYKGPDYDPSWDGPSGSTAGYQNTQATSTDRKSYSKGLTASSEPSYGEKIVLVKVPSANKAALIDKWATTTVSTYATSTGVYNSSTENQKYEAKGTKETYSTSTGKESKTKDTYAVDKYQTKESTGTVKYEASKGTHSAESYDKSKETAKYGNSGAGQVRINKHKESTSSSGSYSTYTNKTNTYESNSDGKTANYGQRYLEKVHVNRNDTLGPEVCTRAGLFRHPYDCQKFYECYWDRWINRYTLHIFKCPVHLVYDEYITACNWPFDGPACVPHEAIKLYS